MRIIRTHIDGPDEIPTQTERDWCYNGLDCCVTLEVLNATVDQTDNATAATYAFSRALQGPILEMNMRGIRVDIHRRSQMLEECSEALEHIALALERIAVEACGMDSFSWSSGKDLQTLFYEKLEIPPIRWRGKLTVDRNALEKIALYRVAEPLIALVEACRDLFGEVKVLRQPLDPDKRTRTSYNIAGTSTGRLSSSYSEYGTGGNLQNITQKLRSQYIADPGYKFVKCDAKSGESYVVGAIIWNLFNDPLFLDACGSGDLHTNVARLCWPELPWPNTPHGDRDLAESPYYRHFTHRDISKKVGHASNYLGQPQQIAQQTRIPIEAIDDFQPLYFEAFPGIEKWHDWTKATLRREGQLTNLLGRKRWFMGRRDAPETQREAIAYDPQGSLSDIVNTAMLNIWRNYTRIQLIAQDHDALTFQYREADEAEVIPVLQRMLIVPVELRGGRILRIPYDCKIGWNRGDVVYDRKTKAVVGNPDGLTDWKGKPDTRKRSPEVSILQRSFSRR